MTRRFPGLPAAVGLLGLALGAQLAAGWAWGRILGPNDAIVGAGLANLTALVAVSALGFWCSGTPPRFAPGRSSPRYWAAIVVTSVAATVVLGQVGNLLEWLFPMPPRLAAVLGALATAPPVQALFAVALVAPLTEESLFRGLLLRGFDQRWGRWPALVLSSALFALFHLNIWQALPAFVAGLYLGSLFLATGSLAYPMVAHAVFNGLPVAASGLGWVIPGYNAPGPVSFLAWPWTVGGLILLVLGLCLTTRWAPLSPAAVSDRVES